MNCHNRLSYLEVGVQHPDSVVYKAVHQSDGASSEAQVPFFSRRQGSEEGV